MFIRILTEFILIHFTLVNNNNNNNNNNNKLTPWVMESGGSMPHSQGLSNNAYPGTNQPNSS